MKTEETKQGHECEFPPLCPFHAEKMEWEVNYWICRQCSDESKKIDPNQSVFFDLDYVPLHDDLLTFEYHFKFFEDFSNLFFFRWQCNIIGFTFGKTEG